MPVLKNLLVINKTNLKQLVPVGRFEPINNLGPNDSDAFAFSPDDQTIAMMAGDHIEVWNIQTGKLISTITIDRDVTIGEDNTPGLLAFSPDGRKLAGLSGGGPSVWDITTGKLLWNSNIALWNPASTETFYKMVFSPDGYILATTSFDFGSDVRIWSVQTGKMIKALGKGNQLDATFSPDGGQLYITDMLTEEEAIIIWDTKTWQRIGQVNIPGQAAMIEISKNGQIMAVSSGDEGDGAENIKIYQVNGWKLLGIIERRDPDDDSPYLISTIPHFNLDGGIIALTFMDNMTREPIPKIELWDTLNQQLLMNLDVNLPSTMDRVEFSPDGKLLMARSENGTAIFWGILPK
jgi:WD40 repeat protein